uniref:Leukocyte surface antigen CD47 n=2 Tax=Ornithorhynchus anatinus TaxID=9258 RepID=A0A6I8PCG6_ORNAN
MPSFRSAPTKPLIGRWPASSSLCHPRRGGGGGWGQPGRERGRRGTEGEAGGGEGRWGGGVAHARGAAGSRCSPLPRAATVRPQPCSGTSGEMWWLPAMLLLLLSSVCRGSAQLLFDSPRLVEKNACNHSVLLPCSVTNIELNNIRAMFVRWKYKGRDIYTFDGFQDKVTISNDFQSASIFVPDILSGNSSLRLSDDDAVLGNYTCEVTEANREGEIIVELRYHVVSWFNPKENILIVIFPILAILLSWGQFGIVTLKYKANCPSEKTFGLIISGIILTLFVIIGAALFIPGEYSIKNASGLGLIVVPTLMLVLLQYCVFMTAFGMTSFAIAILILQLGGYILAAVGLSLCVMVCAPTQGPLLISGLAIIALAELLGLVYMKFKASNQKPPQPPRNK